MSIQRQIFRCVGCGKEFLVPPIMSYPHTCDECDDDVVFCENVILDDPPVGMHYAWSRGGKSKAKDAEEAK